MAMNAFEFSRKLETLTPEIIREIGVKSVLENSEVVISDAIVANAEGLTFAGNKINSNPPFTDWEETGEFHENLKFRDDNNIEFTSEGKGAKAVFSTFPYEDTIAPTAKVLDSSTMKSIQNNMIINVKNHLK